MAGDRVAMRVGVEWNDEPLEPCDQKNFLCIYQEGRQAVATERREPRQHPGTCSVRGVRASET